jgi:ribosome-associated protein
LRKRKLNGASPSAATPVPTWLIAFRAAESKKASEIRVLDLREIASFCDYFLICSGTNVKQNQAIWDEVARQVKLQAGETPLSVEGYEHGEWILGDYGDVIVHVFSPEKREYYQLERLWRDAKDVPVPPEAAA